MAENPAISARRALAIQHVERGRVIIARQRQIIDKIRGFNGDASSAEELLVTFEGSLTIFEDDLDDLEKRDL
jgi:hypothetical protein